MQETTEKPVLGTAPTLSDEDWSEISLRFGLPPEARNPLDETISFLRLSEIVLDEAVSPAKVKKTLGKLARLSNKLAVALKDLSRNPLAVVSLSKVGSTKEKFVRNMNDRVAQQALTAEIASLENLEILLVAASENIHAANPGAQNRALFWRLILKQLDGVFVQFKGRPLIRSRKGKATDQDFIESVCAAAGIQLGPGTIDDALKIFAKRRGELTS